MESFEYDFIKDADCLLFPFYVIFSLAIEGSDCFQNDELSVCYLFATIFWLKLRRRNYVVQHKAGYEVCNGSLPSYVCRCVLR